MKFSLRYQLSPMPASQPSGSDFLTKDLRMGLWNIFLSRVFSFVSTSRDGAVLQDFHVFISLWKSFYKLPLDEYERDVAERKAWYRDQFEALEWFKLLDLVEFVTQKLGKDGTQFIDEVNALFEENAAPFRLSRGAFVPLQSNRSVEALNTVQRLLESHELALASQKLHEATVALGSFKNDFEKNRSQQVVAIQLAIDALHAVATHVQSESLALSDPLRSMVSILTTLNPASVHSHDVFETEFIFANLSNAIRLLLDAGVSQQRLNAAQHTTLKNTTLNIWGEQG